MFVCRVLVGEYTEGDSSYLRPPSKDGGDVHFYDSCVDDINDPSIYVVFEKYQVTATPPPPNKDKGPPLPNHSHAPETKAVGLLQKLVVVEKEWINLVIKEISFCFNSCVLYRA
uniref:PARP catalytic domain-containing protein n=1 Tax=Paramormyrops kingsleyae TaxID=1676925 RepID=A0A3B3THK1_9TELE